MRRSKRKDGGAGNRDNALSVMGVVSVLGISKRTFWRRYKLGVIPGVRRWEVSQGYRYDMEDLFRKVFPTADGNTLARLMYDYRQQSDARRLK